MPKRKQSVLYEWGGFKTIPRCPAASTTAASSHAHTAPFSPRKEGEEGGCVQKVPTTAEELIASAKDLLRGEGQGSMLDTALVNNAILLFESAVKVGLSTIASRQHQHDGQLSNNSSMYSRASDTQRQGCDGDDQKERDAPFVDESAIDNTVFAGESASELLWQSLTSSIPNTSSSSMHMNRSSTAQDAAQRAVLITTSVMSVIRSYRTLCYFGWAQLKYAFLLDDLTLKLQLEESVVAHMLDSLGDLYARLDALPMGVLPTARDVQMTMLVEVRCAVGLCVCERSADAVDFLEGLVERIGLCIASPLEAVDDGGNHDVSFEGAPNSSAYFLKRNSGGGGVSSPQLNASFRPRNASPLNPSSSSSPHHATPHHQCPLAATNAVLAFVLLADAYSAASLDGYEAATAVIEQCLAMYPRHPLPHLVWCLIYNKLGGGGGSQSLSSRLESVLQTIAAVSSGGAEGLAAMAHTLNGSEGYVDQGGDAMLAPLQPINAQRFLLSLIALYSDVASQCGCDAFAVAAVELGMSWMEVTRVNARNDDDSAPQQHCLQQSPQMPLDQNALSLFMAIKAGMCLKKVLAVLSAAGCDASMLTGPTATLQREAEELSLQAERHAFRALQLNPNESMAHLVDGKRFWHAYETSKVMGARADDATVMVSKALLSFEAAVRCNPRALEAYAGAAQCHLQAGRLEEASELLLTSVALQSKHSLIPFEWFVGVL